MSPPRRRRLRSHLGACRDCAAPIVWARTPYLRWIALDPFEDPAGNIACLTAADGTLEARVVGRDSPRLPYERPARTHFATCPHVRRPTTRQLALVDDAAAQLALDDDELDRDDDDESSS